MSYLDEIKSTLHRIKPMLVSKYHVSSIGLFGSITRNDFSPVASDIDIIVDFNKPIGIEFVDLAEDLEKQLARKVDLVSRNGVKQAYFNQIAQDIIYV